MQRLELCRDPTGHGNHSNPLSQIYPALIRACDLTVNSLMQRLELCGGALRDIGIITTICLIFFATLILHLYCQLFDAAARAVWALQGIQTYNHH